MLILTRKPNEEIVINNDIIISVLGIEGDKVRIGISAPRENTIVRRELIEDVKSSNKASADVSAELLSKLKSVYKNK